MAEGELLQQVRVSPSPGRILGLPMPLPVLPDLKGGCNPKLGNYLASVTGGPPNTNLLPFKGKSKQDQVANLQSSFEGRRGSVEFARNVSQ